jgi:CheY-like chemotaxis protein
MLEMALPGKFVSSMSKDSGVVLIVEDELLIRLYAADMLEEAGYRVIEASNADEAIKFLETRTDIRFIFTDIDMPGSMDGLKLAAAVRDRWPPVKIIVTSGHRFPKESDMPAGGRFLPKPYQSSDIVGALEALAA